MQTRLARIGRFFRHGSNLAMLGTLLGLGALMVGRHEVAQGGPYVLGGLLLFPILEYVVHRWVLHAPPLGNGWFYRLQRRAHYDHHRDPDRIELLFTPLFLYVPLVVTYWLLFYAVSHRVSVALALLFGTLLGYLHYEWVHYVAHMPGTPHMPWGPWLKRYHLWHHFKNEHYWFGVTSPLVDMLLGTYRRVDQVEKSKTSRQLFSLPKRW